jgi:ubiquinone/menaquinone biosynthesis C-methylase UbiE
VSEELWRERAGFDDLRSVLDPADATGNKNKHIDLVQKIALGRNFPLSRKHVVLDFGCGTGRFTEWLGARTATVIGLDLTAEMLLAARRLHSNPRFSWVRYGGGRLPFGDETIDRILSVFVIQHVLDESALRRLIAEFARVMRPNGMIALIEQVQASRVSVPGFIEQRTAKEYSDMFAAAGLREYRSLPIRTSWRVASAIVRRPVPKALIWPLAMASIMVARRPGKRASYSDQLMIFGKLERSI